MEPIRAIYSQHKKEDRECTIIAFTRTFKTTKAIIYLENGSLIETNLDWLKVIVEKKSSYTNTPPNITL